MKAVETVLSVNPHLQPSARLNRIRKAFPQLSATEVKICSLLKNNFSNGEIANLLVTSTHAVENHCYRIRKKLNVNADGDMYRLLSDV